MKTFLIILSLFLCTCLFAATPPKVGDEPPYHLIRANAEFLSLTFYGATIVKNDGTVLTLFINANGFEVNLMANGGYFNLFTNASVPAGTYTELRVYTSYSIGLKGYVHYQYDGFVEEPGRYYYTKEGSTHEGILAYTDLMADTGVSKSVRLYNCISRNGRRRIKPTCISSFRISISI